MTNAPLRGEEPYCSVLKTGSLRSVVVRRSVVVAVCFFVWSLAALSLPGAGAYPGTGEDDFQMPFPCGQVWDGHTYESMVIGSTRVVGHGSGNNYAVDFNRFADQGAVVLASARGYAYPRYDPGGLGNVVIIDHGGGYQTVYAHLDQVWVRPGQYVGQGTGIGTVGSTGASSAPHLHYEQRFNGISQHVRFGGVPIVIVLDPNWVSMTSNNSC